MLGKPKSEKHYPPQVDYNNLTDRIDSTASGVYLNPTLVASSISAPVPKLNFDVVHSVHEIPVSSLAGLKYLGKTKDDVINEEKYRIALEIGTELLRKDYISFSESVDPVSGSIRLNANCKVLYESH